MSNASDYIIAAAYFAIPAQLLFYHRRLPSHLQRSVYAICILALFSSFILLCGLTHFFQALHLFTLNIYIKIVTAIVSAITSVSMIWFIPRLFAVSRQVAELDEIVTDLIPADAVKAHKGDLTAKQVRNAIISKDARPVVDQLMTVAESHLPYKAEQYSATIMFMDIVGFTPVAAKCTPGETMLFLHQLFCRIDRFALEFGVYKLETVGDCVVLASGLIESGSTTFHADQMVEAAYKIMVGLKGMKMPDGNPLRLRCGISTGPVITGIVGLSRRRFGVFGDTINTASRMESTSEPDCIQISQATYNELSPTFKLWFSGLDIVVKSKGLMTVFRRYC